MTDQGDRARTCQDCSPQHSTYNRATLARRPAGPARYLPHTPLRSASRGGSHDRSFDVSRASLGRSGRRRSRPVGVQRAQPRGAGAEAGSRRSARRSSRSINRNVDMLFLVDDSSSMRLSQDEPGPELPDVHDHAAGSRPGLPNIHVAVISSDMGAGDGSVVGLRFDGRQERHLPVHGARHLHGDQPAGGRDVHLEHRRRQRTTPATSRTCSPASRRSARAAAASSTSSPPSLRALGADGRGGPPAENQGFLRPDAYLAIILITNEDDCSASPRRPAVRHRLEHQHHVAARPARELPLQRVRPPLRRRSHPNRNAPEQRRHRDGHLHQTARSNDTEGYLLGVVDTAQPDQGAQGRSEPGHRRGDHRARRRPTP